MGIRVARDRSQRRLWLYQDSYIESIAARFNLIDDRPPETPIGTQPLVPNKNIADHTAIYLYQRKIGSILYTAIITRPNITRTASRLSNFLTNPSPTYIAATNRYIQYLYSSRYLAILFNSRRTEEKAFKVYTDVLFADD